MKIRLIAGAVATVFVTATACSTTTGSNAKALQSALPVTATPSPMPTNLTMAEARTAYRAAVAAYNHDVSIWFKASEKWSPHSAADLRAAKRLARKTVRASLRYSSRLIHTRWPRSVRRFVERALNTTAFEVSYWNVIAHAKTFDELVTDSNAVSQGAEDRAAGAIQRLREALGLRPAPA